jgi:hypothetical protein
MKGQHKVYEDFKKRDLIEDLQTGGGVERKRGRTPDFKGFFPIVNKS